MTARAAYRALVQRLEAEAASRPRHYRIKVALLAALGFVVLGGAMFLAFGISVGLVAALLAISPVLLLKLIKVVWIPVALGVVILRALWLRLPLPQGYRLGPGEAPLLQAEIERLRQGAGAPKLSGILIDDELNAAAVSVPRLLGLFGQRHYLVLGLPLMQALDREQLAAVVAHEFGHFGGGHGRFSGWIYRVRASWYRLLEALSAQRSLANALFVRFFDWYAPYFDAYSFVLNRANEYQADATAARLVGAEVTAAALLQTDLASERLAQDFWPGLRRINALQAQPPARLYRKMSASLRQRRAVDAERLAQALGRKADPGDTHPALAERLAALGVAPRLPEPSQRCAAEALLGELAQTLEAHFSQLWQQGVGEAWQQNFEQCAAGRARLALWEQQPPQQLDDKLAHAELVESLRPEQDAAPLYREVLAQKSDHAMAHFRLGQLLLERGQAEGADHLWQAAALEREAMPQVLQMLEPFYHRQADDAGLERVTLAWKAWQREQWQFEAALRQAGRKDVYQPHGLEPEALQALRETLATRPRVGRAWLVRKQIPQAPDWRHYLLLVEWRGLVLDEERQLQALLDALSLPGSVLVLPSNRHGALRRRLRKMQDAEVYARA